MTSLPLFQSKSDLTGGFKTGNQNIAVPTGVAVNDMLWIGVYRESATDTSFTISGFTRKTTITTASHLVHYFYKRATAADTGSYVLALNTDNAWTTAFCLRISGCITTGDPFDGTPVTGSATSGTTAPTVNLTTSTANTLLVYGATNLSGGAWTPPSGMTERTDISDDITSATLGQAAAGASGNKAAVCANGGPNTSFLGALLPVPDPVTFNPQIASQFLSFF
jgi:hypothetical protein